GKFMLFKKSHTAVAVISCVACIASPALWAQTQDTSARIDRVEVTGSNIKRTQLEGPQPVEVITREEIRRKGATSTNELVRSLSYMSSFNDELTSNSPNTSGTAAAGFRGLGADQTVILINGRRLANYGFDGAFTDLNNIPIGAIERVEVLKDGASAIYGADAIGGVINFITRRDYQGLDATAGYGVSSEGDGAETSASLTGGYGDYNNSRFNVLFNLNYFKREVITNLDRERTRSADFRRFGGSNQLSTFAPTGNVLNPTTNQWEPYQPCPSADLLVTPSPLGAGSSCVFDFAPFRPTNFPAERIGGMLGLNFKLAENHRLFGELIYSRNNSFLSAAPAPGNIALSATNPLNRFGTAITVRGRPLQAGPRTTDNVSEATRILAGMDGLIGKYNYNIALGQAKNKTTNNDGGYFLADRMFAAIGNGTFNPFVTTNNSAVVASLVATDKRTGETTYSFADGKLSGELMQLPAGPLGFAVGLTFGKEELNDIPGPNQQRQGPVAGQSNIFGSIRQSPAVADRTLTAGYAEIAAPLLKNLEAQVAVRHDRYEGGTKSTTPKLALRYQPVTEVVLRASYAEGFKMPTLRQLFGGQDQSADSVQDFPGCRARGQTSCARLQYDRFSRGNPDLEPEQSKSYNFGIVVEPTPAFNVGLDYFIINKTDEINLVPTQFVIDSTPYAVNTFTQLPSGAPGFGVTRNAAGTITAINTGNENLGERKIRGVDLSTTLRFNVGPVKMTLGGSGTYYSKYDYADLPGQPLFNRVGLLNLPRWRSQLTLGAEWNAWSGSLLYNNLASMFDKPQATASTPVLSTDKEIGHFETIDLSATYAGFKGLKLQVGVKNLLDRVPPFANNDPRTLGFAQVHDIRGRFFFTSVNYQFQ
ncbi:MAG: TonB-dependent receptor, partial [Burkholderiaceae bacterium]